MNFATLFELTDPSDWSKAAGLDPVLYPEEMPGIDADWLDRVVGVLAGAITVETLFERAISRQDVPDAKRLLRRLNAERQEHAGSRLIELIRKAITTREERRASFLSRIDDFLQREDLNDDEKEYLIYSRSEIEHVVIPQHADSDGYYALAAVDSKLIEHASLLDDIEQKVNRRWKDARERGLRALSEMLPYIQTKLLQSPGEHSPVETVFLALPKLILTGRMSLLEQVRDLAIRGEEPSSSLLEQLTKYGNADGTSTQSFPFKLVNAVQVPFTSPLPLSAMGQRIADGAKALQEPLPEDPRELRTRTSEMLRNMADPERASELCVSAAATLRARGDKDYDMLARALFEAAWQTLQRRKYSQASDLFTDSFKLWVQASQTEFASPHDLSRAAAGVVIASFLPRHAVRNETPPVDVWFNSPMSLLTEIAIAGDNEIVASLWERLGHASVLSEFVLFLESEAPSSPWREIFLGRLLRPRRLISQLHEARDRLRVLLGSLLDEDGNLSRSLDGFLDALEIAKARGRVSSSELNRMRDAITLLDASLSESTPLLVRTLRDALQENVDPYVRDGFAKESASLNVNVSAISATIYPTEVEEGEKISLIFAVKLDQESLPCTSLTVELRKTTKAAESIDDYVSSVSDSDVGLGALEPGDVREIRFDVTIDPRIVEDATEFQVETITREGVRYIDKAKRHTFKVRPGRTNIRYTSPFTPGKALSTGDLFFGREREMSKLSSYLLGDNTEKIPLIIGIRRIGKTTILKHLASEKEILRRYVPFIYDLQDMHESMTTADFLLRLTEKIREQASDAGLGELQLRRNDFRDDALAAFERFTLETSQLRGATRILVIFDEFEKLLVNIRAWDARSTGQTAAPRPEEALVRETLAALRKAILHAPRLSFVVSGIPAILREFESYDARMFGLMSTIKLGPLDDNAARKLISAANLYQPTPDAQSLMLSLSGRQPYLLQVLAEALFHHMVVSGRDTATVSDVEHVVDRDILPNEAYFADYMKLLGEDREIFRAVAIAHRRFGLSRMFVPIESVCRILWESGSSVSRDRVRQLLLEAEQTERPLIERQKTNHENVRLTVGLLIPLLNRGAS